MKRMTVVVLLAVSTLFLGCANMGGGSSSDASSASSSASSAPKAAKSTTVPAGHALSRVNVGMNDTEVRKALGEPSNANAYMTGKAFIPFYFGPDAHRTDWMYNGKGRVVFSRNQWSGALKVIKVIYNPAEGS